MDYRPNIDAAQWFATAALPVMRARRPEARFWIVGAAPTPEVRKLATLPGVQVTGRVPDTRPYIAFADVVVAPLRIARGIQNKVLEAMAMARPVVATPEAFSGVQATPGQDILLASGVDDTVQTIIDVLDGRHATLGAKARSAVEAAHQWSASLRPLDRLFGGAADAPACLRPSTMPINPLPTGQAALSTPALVDPDLAAAWRSQRGSRSCSVSAWWRLACCSTSRLLPRSAPG